MVTHERKLAVQKTKVYRSYLKLNEIEKYIAYMEWYKKSSKEMGIGYYDSDIMAEEYKRTLSRYWHDTVAEAGNKPRQEGAAMPAPFLFAGTNYKKMIEPLCIAEYYKEGGKDYIEERLGHFEENKKKEREEKENPQLRSASKPNSKAKNVAPSLNDDSCFWAHVEEVLVWCNEQASNPDAKPMTEFELYVLNMLENFAVTVDIFLENGSFMHWWNKYKVIVGSNYSSAFTEVMKRKTYRKYADWVSIRTDQ
ncbi:hypothetical protein DVH24_031818 [Malus domestica]|uniref:EDS1 EP domain-containing protein n=1 Tax=Malus domestica TaxID=3750 RepID=A0A498J7S9_MALDO|nr:hypothetical protein DVH24_031818 [Malus domestica]